MIHLHCTPPYNQHIPNPALGYLKGFLAGKGIDVKNVFWNLILAEHLAQFLRGLKDYSKSNDFLTIYPTLYICRQLLTEYDDVKTPLDSLYLSIYSKDEITNMVQSVKEDIDFHIKKNNLYKGIAGFTLKSYQWLMGYYVISRLKAFNPDVTVVIGGLTNKEQAHVFMNMMHQADYAIWGEGEYPFWYFLRALTENTPVTEVPNLVYRRYTLCSTRPFQEYPSLDEYPFADHTEYVHGFKQYMTGSTLSDYVSTFGRHPADEAPLIIPIWGSRSCPWNKCKFCVLNENYEYRARSPESIVEEIEYQSEKHRINSFMFMDTELAGNTKRFKTLLQLLMQSSLENEKKYRFFAEVSPIFITDETAKLMQLASFTEIQIGFEAMTDSLLEKMKKRHRFAHNIQALKLGKRYGVGISGLNILRGIPPETKEDIIESLANIRFLRFLLTTYTLTPGFLRLDKGSPFYEDVSKKERTHWKNNPIWTEVEPLELIPVSEKEEFFGFCGPGLNRLWVDFENLIKFYTKQARTYEWIAYPNGSFVEEKGLRVYKYIFDRDETDLLIFCDTIKTFSDVKKRFPHLSEDDLFKMLYNLKKVGLVYCDENARQIISVLDTKERKVLVPYR